MAKRGTPRGRPLFKDRTVVRDDEIDEYEHEPALDSRPDGPNEGSAGSSSVSDRDVIGPGFQGTPSQELYSEIVNVGFWNQADYLQALIDGFDDGRSGPERTWTAADMLAYSHLEITAMGISAAERLIRPDPAGGNIGSEWPVINEILAASWPDHPERRLSATPPNRFMYYNFRMRFLTEETLRGLADVATGDGVDAAMHAGCLQPRRGTTTDPDLDQVIVGDESQFKAMHNANTKKRRDRTAKLHKNRDGSTPKAPTTKVIVTSVRTGYRNERFPLSFDIRPAKGETDADVTIDAVERIRKLRPDAHIGGVGHDMSMRSEQIDRLLDQGIHAFTKTQRIGRKNNRSRYAGRDLGKHDFHCTNGTTEERVVLATDGSPNVKFVDGNGNICRVKLERGHVEHRERPTLDRIAMSMIWYLPHDEVVDEHLRGASVRIRLNSTDEERDAVPHRRRTTALRAHPEEHPITARYIGRRQDIESYFDTAKSRLPNRRLNVLHEESLIFKGIGLNHKFVNIALLASLKHTGADRTHFYGKYHELGPEVFRGSTITTKTEDIRAGP